MTFETVANNVFSDKDGNVHRRTQDGWESRDQGQWKADPTGHKADGQPARRPGRAPVVGGGEAAVADSFHVMPGPATPLAPLWGIAALLIAGCGAAAPDARDSATPSPPADDQPPVPIDAVPPVEYPPALYEQGVSGTVLLRLFVDDSGTVVGDSSRIQESSGVPALDSAALAAAPKLRYAPALRNGRPVASLFVQPIHFRHPSGELPAP